MPPPEFRNVITGRDIVPVNAATAADALALGPNANSKRGNKIPARAIVYSGAITITTVDGTSRTLIDCGGYITVNVALNAVTGTPANAYMLIY